MDAALKNLEDRDYDRALAMLADAVRRHPNSKEAWDIRCLALALAAKDEEAAHQPRRVVLRSSQDAQREISQVLTATRSRFGNDLASSLAAAITDPGALTKDLHSRLAAEIVTVTVLPVIKLLMERTRIANEILTQIFVESVSRFEQVQRVTASLVESIDAVRRNLQKETDEKFAAIGKLLDEKIGEIEAKQLRLPDYSAELRETLGAPCWEWLGEDVRRIFTSAEGVYRYLARQPFEEKPDFSPALLEYCRGLELLLNAQLGRWCTEVQERVAASSIVQQAVRSHLKVDLDKILRTERTFSIVQMANLLHIVSRRQAVLLGSLSREFENLIAASPGIISSGFLEVAAQVGSLFRNGKVHPEPRSASMFTGDEEMRLLRKLVLGLDEHLLPSDRVLGWVEHSPQLTAPERERACDELHAQWAKYPGLTKSLWNALQPA